MQTAGKASGNATQMLSNRFRVVCCTKFRSNIENHEKLWYVTFSLVSAEACWSIVKTHVNPSEWQKTLETRLKRVSAFNEPSHACRMYFWTKFDSHEHGSAEATSAKISREVTWLRKSKSDTKKVIEIFSFPIRLANTLSLPNIVLDVSGSRFHSLKVEVSGLISKKPWIFREILFFKIRDISMKK